MCSRCIFSSIPVETAGRQGQGLSNEKSCFILRVIIASNMYTIPVFYCIPCVYALASLVLSYNTITHSTQSKLQIPYYKFNQHKWCRNLVYQLCHFPSLMADENMAGEEDDVFTARTPIHRGLYSCCLWPFHLEVHRSAWYFDICIACQIEVNLCIVVVFLRKGVEAEFPWVRCDLLLLFEQQLVLGLKDWLGM